LDQKLEEVKNQQGAVRRKDMDATQQKQHDVARQQAIDQVSATSGNPRFACVLY
jgi:hypothetical protein